MRTADRRLAVTCSAVFALAGCGGGGSSPAPPVATPSPTPPASACTPISAVGRRIAARAGSGAVVPDRLFVMYRPAAGTRGAQSVERAAGVMRAVDLGTSGGQILRAVTLAPGSDAVSVSAALHRDPSVADVQPVHYRSLAGDGVANDQFLDNVDQWYLYKTNVDPGAWAVTHGGASVSVAVIDTGVDETNPDFVFDVKERVVGGVKATGNGVVQDSNGHGTNTSGLAAALTNNSYGFAGVGYATHLQAYDIFPPATAASDCQSADTADEATAIRDAVANGASVISLSIGSPQSGGSDAGERAAVAFAIASGVVVVAAAGNEFPTADGQQVDYPAAYPGVIAVGASGVTNLVANTYASITAETVASYSNSGPTLVAPGGDAATTSDSDFLHWVEGYSTTTAAFAADRCTNVGGVCRVLFNGTSQATPQVAGTVALMEAFHGGPRSLTPPAVTSLLTATADVLPGITSTRQGAGRLNAGKAVAAAHP
jgi:subtilisin family serine protease